MQPMILPDYGMTKHDHAGLIPIMTDYNGLRALPNGHIAAKDRTFPAGNARRFICIEIIGQRGIGQTGEPDVSKTVHHHQRFASGARVPAGDAHQVPHQPRTEEWPDMGKVALKVRMHTS